MELLILLALIVLNGVFALSEIAVVSSKRVRLQHMVEEGHEGARVALELNQAPERFLSTVQIGITLIGIFAGAFGGTALAGGLADVLRNAAPFLTEAADEIALALIVAMTTYLSLVIGELVPKRLALLDPERAASIIAKPMLMLSTITAPLVTILSFSTNTVVRLLGIRESDEPSVTEREVISLVQEGAIVGVFDESEKEMVQAVFQLDDQRIGGLITPRPEIVWLDMHEDEASIRHKISEAVYTVYPVCEGGLDNVLGIIRAKDLLAQIFAGKPIDLPSLIRDASYIPDSVSAADVLKRFRRSGIYAALVISEHGGIDGLVTMHDIVEVIVGDFDDEDIPGTDRDVVERADGSWLLNGTLPIQRLEILFETINLPEERDYETLAGFILAQLHQIPEESDNFTWQNYTFEVMDMDGNRIDKVLVRSVEA